MRKKGAHENSDAIQISINLLQKIKEDEEEMLQIKNTLSKEP